MIHVTPVKIVMRCRVSLLDFISALLIRLRGFPGGGGFGIPDGGDCGDYDDTNVLRVEMGTGWANGASLRGDIQALVELRFRMSRRMQV